MVSKIYGQHYRVYFGAFDKLIHALVLLGERLSPSEDTKTVLSFLRDKKDSYGFNLYPPPEEIGTPERLKFLAQIVALFAIELAHDQPDETLTTDISWDRVTRLSWLARIIDLYNIILEAIPQSDLEFIKRLNLSENDYIDIEINRLENFISGHANPVHHGFRNQVDQWLYSSYDQLLQDQSRWLQSKEVIKWFGLVDAYKKFHEQPIERKFRQSI